MNNQKSLNIDNDEIDISVFFNSLLRNKLIIIVFTLVSTLSTYIYCIKTAPIFSGNFNIVVKEDEDIAKGRNSSLLPGNLQLNKFDEQSMTQLLILKSPYVLKPIYKYVNSYYRERGDIRMNDNYTDWLRSELEVEFLEESKVLKVKYKNYEKDHILNVLNLISKKYQDYSKKSRNRNINKSIDYLVSQKDIMSEKAKKSQTKLNLFSIENGLGDIDGFLDIKDVGFNNVFNPSMNTNTNSNLLQQSLDINNNDIDTSKAGLRFQRQFNLLEKYESSYLDLSSKLKPNSNTLRRLESRIKNLKNSLRRPNEILLKYRELLRQSKIDNALLANIEQNLAMYKLEKIKNPDPWLMISVPTIDSKAVYPRKLFFTAMGFMFSSVFISLLLFLKEKLVGIIYDSNELEVAINCKKIDKLLQNNYELSLTKLKNIIDKIVRDKSNNKILFLQYNTSKLDSVFNEFLNSNNLVVSNNIEDQSLLQKYESIILVIELGNIKRKEISLLNEYIKIYEENLIGFISIEDDLN